MTYSLKGKHYLVIAAGGHGKLGSRQGDYVLAFTLPSLPSVWGALSSSSSGAITA
jgi:hypothetical protein